jgi:hypothetical protein
MMEYLILKHTTQINTVKIKENKVLTILEFKCVFGGRVCSLYSSFDFSRFLQIFLT